MTTCTDRTTVTRHTVDILLLSVVTILVVFGLWMVLDTTYPTIVESSHHLSPLFYVKKQLKGAIFGVLLMLSLLYTDYRKLNRLFVPGMLIGIGLLLTVYIPHIGISANGAARWAHFGTFTFQPSEVAKLLLIFYVAGRLSCLSYSLNKRLKNEDFIAVTSIAGIYLLLIERQPDLGTAAALFLTFIVIQIMANARIRQIIVLLGGVSVLVLLSCTVGKNHVNRVNRLIAFVHPRETREGSGYQVYRARLSIGSGEWDGVGLGRGVGKYYLPQNSSDFVFATIAEETGFGGCMVLLSLLLFVTLRGFAIAYHSPDTFGRLLACGISGLIGIQTLFNVGVATGSMPTTGVPLPFISEGSSSLIITLVGIGFLLSISRQNALDQEESIPIRRLGEKSMVKK